MKTAISLPDDLFERVDRCARQLKLTRSGFLAAAARAFLARHQPDLESATEAWNKVIDEGVQPGDDPAATAARSHSLRVVQRRLRKRS